MAKNTEKALAKKWLSALRSRNYKQCKSQLKISAWTDLHGAVYNDKHCCLGVLCEVAKIPFNDENGFPPEEAALRLGLSGYGDQPPEGHLFRDAATWNDKGLKFYQIARKIERRLLAA